MSEWDTSDENLYDKHRYGAMEKKIINWTKEDDSKTLAEFFKWLSMTGCSASLQSRPLQHVVIPQPCLPSSLASVSIACFTACMGLLCADTACFCSCEWRPEWWLRLEPGLLISLFSPSTSCN